MLSAGGEKQPESPLHRWGCFCSVTQTLRAGTQRAGPACLSGWKLVLPPCLSTYGKTSAWEARSSCSAYRFAAQAAVTGGLGAKARVLPPPWLGVLGWVGSVGCPQALTSGQNARSASSLHFSHFQPAGVSGLTLVTPKTSSARLECHTALLLLIWQFYKKSAYFPNFFNYKCTFLSLRI